MPRRRCLRFPVTRAGDLWVCGPHRVLCGDATSQQAGHAAAGGSPAHPDGDRSSLRDRTRFGVAGPCRAERLRTRRGQLHETANRGPSPIPPFPRDTRADWSAAFELVPEPAGRLTSGTLPSFTREVLDGLLRIGFLYPQQIIWNKGRTVLTRTHYWYPARALLVRAQEERALVRKGRRELDHLGFAVAEIHHGRIGGREVRSSHAETGGADAAAHSEPHPAWGIGLRSVSRQRDYARRGGSEPGVCVMGLELDPKYVDVVVQRGRR